jgi:hypothetical protein
MLHRTDKKICFFKSNGTDNTIYNGDEYSIIDNRTKNEMIKRPYDYEYILVPYDGKDYETDYKEYIKMIDDINNLTDGKINMYKTGSYSNTALCLFNSMNNNKEYDKVMPYEFPYLENGGGVRVGEPYKGVAYKYDINSYYPSILNSKTAKFPISPGKLTDITTEDIKQKRFVKFGVYHAEIECDNSKKFTTISTNMYSHSEINYAKQLGLNITILGQCITWDEDQLRTFNSIFGDYVDYLYPLKKKHKGFKLILNSLWGSLVQKRGGVITYRCKWEDLNPDKQIIIKTNPIDDEYCMLTEKIKISFFKTTYARLNPFLLGLARVQMHKTFCKIGYDNLLWSHTDSMITSAPLTYKQIKINNILGNWKYEGRCKKLKIINKNIYKCDFE